MIFFKKKYFVSGILTYEDDSTQNFSMLYIMTSKVIYNTLIEYFQEEALKTVAIKGKKVKNCFINNISKI